MTLKKEDLIRLLLDYQGKFYFIMDDLKNNFDRLRPTFTKLEVDLNVSKNVYSKLLDTLIIAERQRFTNEQYSRTECLKILGISPSVKDNELETKVLNTPEETDAPVIPGLIEDR